ncbi:MAG: aminotransferase class I/II-fold pyridoxal phosphate-dependent enzyme, partial [Rubrobacter sp.]
ASITAEEGFSPSERTIILDGFSKTYAMTGWRIGYGVMPVELARHIDRLQVNSNSCTNAAAQQAAIAAIAGPQDAVEAMREEFRVRCGLMADGLNGLPGFECAEPKGAFYTFPRVTETGLHAAELADRLLEEAGVACLSGTGFGEYGEGHLRFSCANSRENIAEAVERIRGVLASR